MRSIVPILIFLALVIAPAAASVPDTGTATPLVASFTADPTEGSVPLVVHFTDTSTGLPTGWLWDFGDGGSSTEPNPVHTYTLDGIYVVTLFAERAEPHAVSSVTQEIFVLVGAEVVADFTANRTSGDAPLSVRFTDASTEATRWSWSFGDGGTSYDRNPAHVYTVPGNYTVSLRAESDFRTDTETKTGYISVTGPIAASFTPSSLAVPVGDPVPFTDTSTGNPYTFAWDFGDGTTSTERNPAHAYSTPGTYTVSLTATNPLYSDTRTETDHITVYDQVTARFGANVTRGGVPLTVQFTDLSTGTGITSWSWNLGDGGTSTLQNPNHTYTRPGIYDVSLTVSNGYTSHTSTAVHFVIAVYGELTAQFTANRTTGPAPLAVRFTDTSPGSPTTWAWNFGDGGTSTERNPVHTYLAAGTYTVNLTVEDGGTPYSGALAGYITVTARPPAVAALPGVAGPPADLDGDGLCEDLNANGRPDFADVVLYFTQMTWIAANEPVPAFDYNGNGRIDFGDVVRLFDGISADSQTPTSTPTPLPTTSPVTGISGRVLHVNETGTVQGPIAGVTIALELVSGDVPEFPQQGMSTTTDANGSYSFTVPDVPATYRLTETGLDPAVWSVYSPPGGVIEGVLPGGAGYDFMNRQVGPDGIAIYLNKTVGPGCTGGYVVDGTTIMGDARSGDHVTINYQRYQFRNNEQFRFTIEGNQTAGRLFVAHEELSTLTFNVRFEARDFGTTEWMVPPGFSNQTGNPTIPINIGVPSSVSISAINKNLFNDESTLTYRHPVCAPSDTRLLLNGVTRIDVRNPPGDATYLEFTDLHAVRDIQYGEGLNTMWLYLEPTYDYLLAQGVCTSP